MKVAILSDAHDGLANFKQALKTIHDMGIKTVLFCGDFNAPPMLLPFKDFPDMKAEVVFGNNDGDRFRMAMLAQNIPNITLHGEYAALEVGGKRIGMTHYPFYAEAMAKSGDYNMVAFGHDHEARVLNFGDCLAVNPGAMNMLKPGSSPSFAIYDTANHVATLHNLDGSFLEA